MPRSKGYRRKTRSLLTKDRKVDSGLSSIIREYKVNDRVVIRINPSIVKGMPHRRYHGKVGVVEKVFRRALLVNIEDGGKTKKIIARMEHVKPFKL